MIRHSEHICDNNMKDVEFINDACTVVKVLLSI